MTNPTPSPKSKLGIIAAILAVMVVVMAGVLVVVLVNVNNSSKLPTDNYVAQDTNTESPSTDVESSTSTPYIPIQTEQTTDPTSISADNSTDEQNTALPILDKVVTVKENGLSMTIPDSWDYSEKYGQLLIDSGKSNIRLSAQVNQQWIFDNYDSYDNIDFAFADGNIGTYSKDSLIAVFAYPLELHYLFFVVEFYEDEEWYSQNEELLYALAKTLSIQDYGAYQAYLVQEQNEADAWEEWLAQEQQNQQSVNQDGQQSSTNQTKKISVTAVSEATIVTQPDSTGLFSFRMVCKSCGWTKDSSMFATYGSFGASSFKCSKCDNYIKPTFRGE